MDNDTKQRIINALKMQRGRPVGYVELCNLLWPDKIKNVDVLKFKDDAIDEFRNDPTVDAHAYYLTYNSALPSKKNLDELSRVR